MSNSTTMTQAAKDFGYEPQKQAATTASIDGAYKPSTPDLPSAILVGASALGKDDSTIARLLQENKLQLETVNNAEGTFLQLNDISQSDKIPVSHIPVTTVTGSEEFRDKVEQAAADFDRLGHKDASHAMLVSAQQMASEWADTSL